MKYLIIALILLSSCSKKDKCYQCEITNKTTQFGIVKKTIEHCGTKQSLKEFIKDNTVEPWLVDIDSNGNKLYNSRTLKCK